MINERRIGQSPVMISENTFSERVERFSDIFGFSKDSFDYSLRTVAAYGPNAQQLEAEILDGQFSLRLKNYYKSVQDQYIAIHSSHFPLQRMDMRNCKIPQDEGIAEEGFVFRCLVTGIPREVIQEYLGITHIEEKLSSKRSRMSALRTTAEIFDAHKS